MYKMLFTPLTIHNMILKNRIVMPPMGTNFALPDGSMSEDHLKYYEQRAKGGTGLIIVENACIDFPYGSNGTTQIRIDHDRYIPGFYRLNDMLHRYGAKTAIQINHAGASAVPSRIGGQPVSSSSEPSKQGGAIPRPLLKEEILEIVEKYGQAARRVKTAGFDAIEIHAGHSYLLCQFLSPLYNKRTDEFGGNPENRARFAKLVLERVRAEVGPAFPILLRISADEFVTGGNTLEDTLELLSYLQEKVDVLNVSAAVNDSLQYQIDQMNLPDGWRAYLAKAVKERFGKPTIATGNYRDPAAAEQTLVAGDADLIGIGRGLIAEPEWVNKVSRGDEADLRKCISCNIGCAGHRIGLNRPIQCSINPDLFYGEQYKQRTLKKRTHVVVIGGGTAGLEAACTAAEVGCTTFLLEKGADVGGLASQISRLPDKRRIADFPAYLKRRSEKLQNLITFTDTEASIGLVEDLHPDVIVNATGSVPLLPPISGLKEHIDQIDGKVHSIFGVLSDVERFPNVQGERIVVIGGGAVGLDVVEFFAEQGAQVTIVERLPELGKDLDIITRLSMMDMLRKFDVEVLTNTSLTKVADDHFKVEVEGQEKVLSFAHGFVCLGMRPERANLQDLDEYFSQRNVRVVNIGDSLGARKIMDGVREGRNVLSTLEQIGAL
ncbi:NAD(P)/FAD-dependent oxidoreductase [Paenibacillus silvae]|uniref:2,4-dienoyl-CoA reductase n=1 Tax=Paenibacillus silvae TaxID=1325358 RepID=A0A2W6PA79_9BACL|nr:NAD(P)/FAD-dependent oxidoreductase [Paenibacillus silvae]PZT56590.1 2,4-dienoyl-CoA reductase [Paenibacillus silvae]